MQCFVVFDPISTKKLSNFYCFYCYSTCTIQHNIQLFIVYIIFYKHFLIFFHYFYPIYITFNVLLTYQHYSLNQFNFNYNIYLFLPNFYNLSYWLIINTIFLLFWFMFTFCKILFKPIITSFYKLFFVKAI